MRKLRGIKSYRQKDKMQFEYILNENWHIVEPNTILFKSR